MTYKAINNLAVTDENKVKIVEAGALPHYVTLLSPQREENECVAAAHGLWMLSFSCKDTIITEPGCLDGHYFIISSIPVGILQRELSTYETFYHQV